MTTAPDRAARLGLAPVVALAERGARRAPRSRLRILAYHGIEDPETFAWQMELLQHDYSPVSTAHVAAALRGEALLPAGAVWVTFDDGLPSVVEHALPVLERLGVPATLFVCPGLVESGTPNWWDVVTTAVAHDHWSRPLPVGATDPVRYLKTLPDPERRAVVDELAQDLGDHGIPVRTRQLTLAELGRWRAAGNDVGNHSWDHPCLDTCSPEEQRRQVVDADEWLREHGLHGVAPVFAYPNGNATSTVEQTLTELGYELALVFDHRIARVSQPRYRVSRLRVSSTASPTRFRAILSGLHSSGYHSKRRLSRGFDTSLRTAPPVDDQVLLRVPQTAESGTSYRLEVAHGIEALAPAGDWNELVASSADGSFFQSAEWITAWWHELAGKPETAVARVFSEDRVVAGAALARARTPLLGRLGIGITTVVSAGSGTGAADHGGFPVVTGAPPEVVDALWEWAQGWHHDDPMVLRSLGPDAPIAKHVGASLAAVDEELCPRAVIAPGTDFETITAGWTKNRRKTIGKKLRDFASRGGAFEWIDEPDRIRELLPTVFRLHDARRANLGRSTRFGHDDASRRFHRRLIAESSPTRGCWLQLATVDGSPVGILYGFRFDDVYSVYQSGWEPSLHDVSLGLIQYATAYRHVVERGGRVFDMCRGDDAYKLRFATETIRELTYARTTGAAGVLLAQRFRFDAHRRARRVSAGREGVDVTELRADGLR